MVRILRADHDIVHDHAVIGNQLPLVAAVPKCRHTEYSPIRLREQHIERHLELADQLWRGEPPELWEAAQRLLDLGEDRHAVLHALMDTIRTAGPRAADIAAALSALPPIEP